MQHSRDTEECVALDEQTAILTAHVAAGNVSGVHKIVVQNPGIVNRVGLDGTSPLCAAALWGHTDVLRVLLEAAAAPGLRNSSGDHWTPLHAAAMQEQGKACMLLLDHASNPQDLDASNITPCDYASASEAIWPLFAARGCQRLPKAILLEKGVLHRTNAALERELQHDPRDQYLLAHKLRPHAGVLTTGKQRQPIDILEKEDATALPDSQKSFHSLGI